MTAYEKGYKVGFHAGCYDEQHPKLPENVYNTLKEDFNKEYADEYQEGYAFGFKEGFWNG